MSTQIITPIQQPPYEIYELLTAAQGVLSVKAIDGSILSQGLPLSDVKFVDPSTTVAPADRTGAATAPFATLAAAIAALPAGGTLMLVPGAYPAEVINLASGLNFALVGMGWGNVQADLTAVSITTTGNLDALFCALGPVVCLGLSLYFCNLSGGGSCEQFCVMQDVTVNSNFDFGTTAGEVLLQAFNCDIQNAITVNDGDFYDCRITNDVTNLGADAGGNIRMFNTELLSPATVGGAALVFDHFTWRQRNDPNAFSFSTTCTLIDSAASGLRSEIGYAAAAPTVLVVLPAGHLPGLYSIHSQAVVRTVAGAGTLTRTIGWSAPTIGAQTRATTGISMTALGSPSIAVETIESDGTADITVTFTPVGLAGGPPAIDLYSGSIEAGMTGIS